MPDALADLTGINLTDLVDSFGWQDSPRLAAAIRGVFRAPAEKFARLMLRFDSWVGENGLPAGARRTLRFFVRDVRASGRENLPKSGPVLFLSNHPGMSDALSLFTAIGRPDLRIIASNRPFLQSLPNTRAHLYFISDNSGERMSAVKKAAAHLRAGGALLTFPAGKIEPDPGVYPGALESLAGWSDSAGVFVRFAPETYLVPVLVRNVLWERAVRHPLTYFKHGREDRERLGAAFQLLAHIAFNRHPVTVRIQFARPVTAAEVGSTEVAALHAAVIGRMRELVNCPPGGEGESIL
jgi:hypothetical protein